MKGILWIYFPRRIKDVFLARIPEKIRGGHLGGVFFFGPVAARFSRPGRSLAVRPEIDAPALRKLPLKTLTKVMRDRQR